MRSEEDDVELWSIGLIVMMIFHLIAIILRAAERIHASWALILIPEIILAILFVLAFIQLIIHCVREWREHKD